MDILDSLRDSTLGIGIKEVARRAGLPASTVSRFAAGQMSPSFEIVQKISRAIGLQIEFLPETGESKSSRLIFVKRILSEMKDELKFFGIQHVTVFGAVAHGHDDENSAIELSLGFEANLPFTNIMTAEARIAEVFGAQKIEFISQHNEKGIPVF